MASQTHVSKLRYRNSYQDNTGQIIQVWSDPYEPLLEAFDHTFLPPTDWVQANEWLYEPKEIKPRTKKKLSLKERREREDRESTEDWGLTSPDVNQVT